MIDVTAPAVEKLKTILEEEQTQGAAIRVIMVPSGNGAQYMLTLESEPTADDIVNEYDGVRILIDGDAAPIMEGAQIDYVDDFTRSGFIITNPNMPSSGGCGGGGGGGCGCGSGGSGSGGGGCGSGGCACGAGL